MNKIISVIKILFLVIEIYIFSKGAKDKMKNLKNWLKSNKGAIISLLTFILSISELVFGWILGEKTIYVAGFNLVAVVGLVISVLIGIFTSGFSSAKVQEAVDKVKNQLKLDAHNGLTYEERVKIGRKINTLEKKKVELKTKNQSVIDNVEVFGIATPQEKSIYNQYKVQIETLDSQIKQLKAKLGEVEKEDKPE